MKSGQYKGYDVQQSIVNKAPTDTVSDKNEPLTYIDWLKHIGQPVTVLENTSQKTAYNTYLNDWRRVTNDNNLLRLKNIESVYGTFFQELKLELSRDEERYIKNIDYSDSIEIESALSFFTEKIKTIARYYAQRREQLKFETPKKSLKGTSIGIEKTIYNEITNFLFNPDNLISYAISENQRDAIVREINIVTEELYDIDYNQYSSNIVEYDPYIFIDYDQAVRNLLASTVEILGESDSSSITTNENSEISLTIKDPDITDIGTQLTSKYFENYDANNLNLQNLKSLVELSTGSKTYYLSAGEDGEVKTGQLFDSSKNIQNIFNRATPVVSTVPSKNIKTIQQLGGFYRPQNLGYINYYSYHPIPQIKTDLLNPGELYIYADLTTGSNTNTLPVDYDENVEFVKYDNLEPSISGEIRPGTSNIPKFNNYTTSLAEDLQSHTGISRHEDAFDFWTGEHRDIWSSADVYTSPAPNILPVDDRQSTILADAGDVYNTRSDIYGNEYALLKPLKPLPVMSMNDFKEPLRVVDCSIMDGYRFKDLSYQPTQYSYGVNDIGGTFQEFEYQSVRIGKTFLDTKPCMFSENSSSNTEIEIPGRHIMCDTLDGYMFGYRSLDEAENFFPFPPTGYELYSSNIDLVPDVGFTYSPIVNNIWDGGILDQVCIPNVTSERYFKLHDTEKHETNDFLYNQTEFSATSGVGEDFLDHPNIPGYLYIRNADSSTIGKFNIKMLSIFSRYSEEVRDSINTELIDIDIIQNVLVITTKEWLILDQISYDYVDNTLIASKNPQITRMSALDANTSWEVTAPFYNERTNDIVYGVVYTTSSGFAKCLYFFIDISTFRVDLFATKTQDNEIISEIASPNVTYCNTTKRYYVTFIGSYNDRFCIGQFALKPAYNEVDTLNVFYSSKPWLAASTTPELSGSISLNSTEDTYYIGNIETPIYKLAIDTSAVTIDTVMTIDVDFGDSTTQTYTRTPVIDFTSEKNQEASNGDPRSPAAYLINHTYNNTSPNLDIDGLNIGNEIKCQVTIHTVESPTPIIKTIHLTQFTYDILSHSEKLHIIDTKVYVDKYGSEKTFITFTLKSKGFGDYVTSVMIKSMPSTREQIEFRYSDTGTLEHAVNIDDSNIKATGEEALA